MSPQNGSIIMYSLIMFTELFFESEIKQIKLILSVFAFGPFIFLMLFE